MNLKLIKLIIFIVGFLLIETKAQSSSLVFKPDIRLINQPSLVSDSFPTDDTDSIKIHFNVKILYPNKFGYFFHFESNNKKQFSILSINNSDDNTNTILISLVGEKSYKYVLKKDENRLRFSILLTKRKIQISVNNSRYALEVGNILSGKSKFVFGAYDEFSSDISDFILDPVNIELCSDKDKRRYFWDFKNVTENFYFDGTNTFKLTAFNVISEKDFHSSFINKKIIKTTPQNVFVFDKHNNSLLMFTRESVIEYNISTDRIDNTEFKNKIPIQDFNIILSNKNYYAVQRGGGGDISVYNKETGYWSGINNDLTDREKYNSIVFEDPYNNDFYNFGGYGFYKFNNEFKKFNKKTRSWETVIFTGDTIYPRNPRIIENYSDSSVIILGGGGNRTGNQTLPITYFRDFYEVDFKNNIIRKLGEIPSSFLPDYNMSSAVYDSNSKMFYSLFYKIVEDSVNFRVASFTSMIEDIKDSGIEFYLSKSEVTGYFFISERNKEIIYLINSGNQQNEVIVSSLHYLLSKPEAKKKSIVKNNSSFYLILTLVIPILGVVLFFIFKQRKQPPIVELNYTEKNRVLLFGDFCVLDRDGEDITGKLPLKLTETFLLILISSIPFNEKNGKGISSVKLSNMLWPDKDKESQKNNRNVTIKKIRVFLESLDGIELIFKNGNYLLVFHDYRNCDYLEYLTLYKNDMMPEINRLIKIVSKGPLFQNVSFEWLDPMVVEWNNEIISNLIKLLSEKNFEKDDDLKISIGKAILKIDPVSETGLSLILNTYNNQNNRKAMDDYFSLFKQNYFMLYNEKFPRSLESFLKN